MTQHTTYLALSRALKQQKIREEHFDQIRSNTSMPARPTEIRKLYVFRIPFTERTS